MPQDFFAQGFGEQQGIAFTKEQDEFLQKKLVFLDPMKTYQISIGKALALLKYTNLDNETIKKILNNSCKSGIGQKIITHEEMKKIFRGVALKQNKIEPSKINIEANIKTKMPIFYDEDDDSEEEQQKKPQPQKAQIKQPEPQRSSVNAPPSHVTPVNQPPQQPKLQQAPTSPLKAFDEYWKNLKTKNNLIDGTQVKKMFSGNNSSKHNLSKAWKLCNISEKGVLTKGQFFIFMNLIHSNNIPESLTKEMKDLIHQIQQACGYRKNQIQGTNQRTSTTSAPSQKEKSSSNAFDKFGQQILFVKNASEVEGPSRPSIQKNISNVFSVSPQSLPVSSTILSSNQNIPSVGNKNALHLLQKVESVSRQQKSQEKQLSSITMNNQQMATGLGSIQQYLSVVQRNLQATTAQIEGLKQSQQSLNERLNSVCLNFKNIITKQSECISVLMENMKLQSQSSTARLQVLESYTEQMLVMVESGMQTAKHRISTILHEHTHSYEHVKSQNQKLRQKLSHHLQNQTNLTTSSQKQRQDIHMKVKVETHQHSPQNEHTNRTDPFDDNQTDEQHNDHNVNYGQEGVGSDNKERFEEHQQPTNHYSQENNKASQQQGHIFLENLSPEERKKTKQMLLIQILNSVSSMNQEQYAQVVSKVVAMSQEQMNQSYTKLYALYMQNLAKTGVSPKYPVPSPEQFTASQS